jgi:cell division septum initiation protein DivIVA
MSDKEVKEDTVELWGNTFKKVESGLDVEEVNAYIKKVVGERDKLLNRQEHLAALAELAEKTVTEADKMAERIKEEAKVQAEEEAKGILEEAEKQAQQIVDEKTSEAVENAQKDIEVMKLEANESSQKLLKDNIEKLQINIMDVIDVTFKEIMSQAESLHKDTAKDGEAKNKKSADYDGNGSGEVKDYKGESGNKGNSPDKDEKDVKVEVQNTKETEEIEEEQLVSKTDWWATENQEWIVVEFLPPRDQDGIEQIEKYINGLPEVNTTEIVTMVDKTWIKVLINKENDLMNKLNNLNEIQQVYEVEEDEYRKMEVELDLTSSIDMSRNKLNRNFSNILSRQR